ncbi:uncharacterized protein RJT20DRAFT_127357 [Scheffersomyces xylosifermentans]|uniref:uncharacterized protein n=1 Tax=Scheffersomyces xylosifermentans TaxID=1304137 RepID=UPI00315CBD2D
MSIFRANMVNYIGKLCLAPMVRSGELPNRLMALRHGADLVWSPELVDKKLIQVTRVVNNTINTIDFVTQEPHGPKVAFRTYPKEEKGKLICQIGSSDPDLAVEAALKVIEDVDGVDLNCGCPKPFSTHSGMGAALLSTPDLLCSILTNLVEKVGKPHNKPISCKIRLLNNLEDTRDLVDKICSTGIANLTIHCRQRGMRNRQEPIWHYLAEIIPQIQSKGVSVIINGNLQSRSDLAYLQELFNNDQIGGMLAESAEANPTVFSEQPWTQDKAVEEFYTIAKEFGDIYAGSKFMMLNMIPGKSQYYRRIAQSRTFEEMGVIIKEISEDKEDKFIHKILNKDLQKQRCLTQEEFVEHMEKRKTVMEQLATKKHTVNDHEGEKRRNPDSNNSHIEKNKKGRFNDTNENASVSSVAV